MKHKTSELTGALLDAAVAKAEGRLVLKDEPGWQKGEYLAMRKENGGQHVVRWYGESGELGGWEPLCNQGSPSTRWEDGGPIIERGKLMIEPKLERGAFYGEWRAVALSWEGCDHADCTGPTPLIAAMRTYVASKLGEEVDL